jgi:hypothetical protein
MTRYCLVGPHRRLRYVGVGGGPHTVDRYQPRVLNSVLVFPPDKEPSVLVGHGSVALLRVGGQALPEVGGVVDVPVEDLGAGDGAAVDGGGFGGALE